MKDMASGDLSADTSAILAQHVHETDWAALPPEAAHAFKRSLLDYLGCAIAGMDTSSSRGMLRYYEENGTKGDCTVIGAMQKLPPADAALMNGSAGHAFDFDEGHTRGGAHPASVLLPVALAMGERWGASIADVMLATVLGYDVMLRLCCAIHPESARAGWHNTGIAGVFGAAAVACKLRRLSAARIQSAFGIAGSFAGGTLQFMDNGADTKRLHPGKAAHDGILAAGLAAQGLTGPARAWDGDYGFLRLHGGATGQASRAILTTDLGSRFSILDTYIKPFPCNRHFHAALDGVLALRSKHALKPEMVRSMTVRTYGFGVHGHTHLEFKSLFDAQSSLPFMAALVLMEGQVPLSILDGALSRRDILELAGRISAEVDPGCEQSYPRERSAIVRIEKTDGRADQIKISNPLGEASNPVGDDGLAAKFRGNCQHLLGKNRCAALIDMIWHCDDYPTLAPLLEAARPEPVDTPGEDRAGAGTAPSRPV